MLTNQQFFDALRKAAEGLLDRRLTADEARRLTGFFNRAKGTYSNRAREALKKITGHTGQWIEKRAAASDNTDRVIRDLESVLNDWNPAVTKQRETTSSG